MGVTLIFLWLMLKSTIQRFQSCYNTMDISKDSKGIQGLGTLLGKPRDRMPAPVVGGSLLVLCSLDP